MDEMLQILEEEVPENGVSLVQLIFALRDQGVTTSQEGCIRMLKRLHYQLRGGRVYPPGDDDE